MCPEEDGCTSTNRNIVSKFSRSRDFSSPAWRCGDLCEGCFHLQLFSSASWLCSFFWTKITHHKDSWISLRNIDMQTDDGGRRTVNFSPLWGGGSNQKPQQEDLSTEELQRAWCPPPAVSVGNEGHVTPTEKLSLELCDILTWAEVCLKPKVQNGRTRRPDEESLLTFFNIHVLFTFTFWHKEIKTKDPVLLEVDRCVSGQLCVHVYLPSPANYEL